MKKATREAFVGNIHRATGLIFFVLLSSLFNSHPVMGSDTGPLTVHPTNPRYFADGTGEAIYLTGSHSWYFFQDWSGSDMPPLVFDELVNLLKTNNHNFVRGWVCKSTNIPWGEGRTVDTQVYERADPSHGTAWDGGAKFDLSEFNEDFFTQLRERAVTLGENGIYMSMMMFWDTARSGGDYWDSHVYNINNNINDIDGDFNWEPHGRELYNLDALTNPSYPEGAPILALHEAFVRKTIDTLGDLDNVLWEIGNELSYPYSVTLQDHFIDYIHTYEENRPKQHPVCFSAMIGSDGEAINDILFDSSAEWITPVKTSPFDYYSYDPPASDGTKVVVSDTDHISIYLPAGSDDKERDYRQWTWKSFTRGLNTILMDNPLSTWDVTQVHALRDARRYMGDTMLYAERMDLASMTPQDAMSSTAYCLANPGGQYIIYQPDGGAFSVDMAAGDYFYEWFNPEVGIVEQSGTINIAGGESDFVPPFSGEAVLYLSTSSSTSPFPSFISQEGWELEHVDSEEINVADGAATNCFDGDPDTIWTTEWEGENDPVHPHEIQIDLGECYDVCQFRYLPRQNDGPGGENGMIKDYEFYVSDDPNDWGDAVASGSFMSSKKERTVLFDAKRGRYIRLVALSEINGNAWTTIAELNVLSAAIPEPSSFALLALCMAMVSRLLFRTE